MQLNWIFEDLKVAEGMFLASLFWLLKQAIFKKLVIFKNKLF